MKNLSTTANAYILGTILIGLGLLVTQFQGIAWYNPGLYLLAAISAAAQTLKVEDPYDKTNYNIAWFVYGFTFIALGTPGRLRRWLGRTTFSDLPPVLNGRIRKKSSVTDHLPKGILGHGRSKQPALA